MILPAIQIAVAIWGGIIVSVHTHTNCSDNITIYLKTYIIYHNIITNNIYAFLIGKFRTGLSFFERAQYAIPSQQGKFLKILRIEMENYSHHHDNGNVLNQTSMNIDLFNTNL